MITHEILAGSKSPTEDSFPWQPSTDDLEQQMNFNTTDLDRANAPFYTNTGY